MPLKMHRTATRLRSPPRFCVAGVARAKVRLRAGKERALLGVMPIAWHTIGYPKSDRIAILIVGITIGKN